MSNLGHTTAADPARPINERLCIRVLQDQLLNTDSGLVANIGQRVEISQGSPRRSESSTKTLVPQGRPWAFCASMSALGHFRKSAFAILGSAFSAVSRHDQPSVSGPKRARRYSRRLGGSRSVFARARSMS